jgi:hypothetical protein
MKKRPAQAMQRLQKTPARSSVAFPQILPGVGHRRRAPLVPGFWLLAALASIPVQIPTVSGPKPSLGQAGPGQAGPGQAGPGHPGKDHPGKGKDGSCGRNRASGCPNYTQAPEKPAPAKTGLPFGSLPNLCASSPANSAEMRNRWPLI